MNARVLYAVLIAVVMAVVTGARGEDSLQRLDQQLFGGTGDVERRSIKASESSDSELGADWQVTHHQMIEATQLLREAGYNARVVSVQQDVLAELDRIIAAAQTTSSSPASTTVSRSSRGAPEPARDASKTDAEAPQEASVNEVFQQVWGTLPPNLRTDLHSMDEGSILPNYRQRTEAYFRVLAREREWRDKIQDRTRSNPRNKVREGK